MAGFEYQALDTTGRTVRGVIDGDAERQVRGLLRERGLTPLQVNPIRDQETATPGARRSIGVRRGISGSELALLTRQFATLVRAGLTLEECLNALIEQTEKARTRHVLAGVRGRMLEGQSLARSMAAFPQAFPDIYRVMVDAGEQSGRLIEVLNEYSCEGPPLSVVYLRATQHLAKVRVFAEFAADLMRNYEARMRRGETKPR